MIVMQNITHTDIEDILSTMDLSVDISYIGDEVPSIIKIELPLFDDLVNHIYNRINNRSNHFMILSRDNRTIVMVNDLIKALEDLRDLKGNFQIGVELTSNEECSGYTKTYVEYDQHRPYLYGYISELKKEDIINICEEELRVFKTHLRMKFYEYNDLLKCSSIKKVFLDKLREDKLKRITK